MAEHGGEVEGGVKFDHAKIDRLAIRYSHVWRAEWHGVGNPAVQAHNQREHQRGTREYKGVHQHTTREHWRLSVLVAKLALPEVEKLSLVRIDKNGTNEIDDNEMRLYEDSE